MNEPFGVAVQVRGSGRQFHRIHADLGQRGQELCGEQRIPVMNQLPLALEQPVLGIGQIASDLIHPQPICVDRDTGKLDAAGR